MVSGLLEPCRGYETYNSHSAGFVYSDSLQETSLQWAGPGGHLVGVSPPVMSVLWRKVCLGAGTEINDIPQKPVEELGCCFEMCRLALFWTFRILSSYCPFLYFSFPQLFMCFYTVPSWLSFSSIIKPFAFAYSRVKLLLHIIWVTWGRKHRQLV